MIISMKSSNREILSISELNKTVKGLLETEFSFLYVEGEMSNFSFYYAHHMSTIEGGMICTNDRKIFSLAKIWFSVSLLFKTLFVKYKYWL